MAATEVAVKVEGMMVGMMMGTSEVAAAEESKQQARLAEPVYAAAGAAMAA